MFDDALASFVDMLSAAMMFTMKNMYVFVLH